MNLAAWLLTAALSIPTTTLVLRDGHRIGVDGNVRQENGRVTFRVNGALFSIPESEVDLDATRAAINEPIVVKAGDEPKAKLRVSDEERKRLLSELEGNHLGKPAPPRAEEPLKTKSDAEKKAESAEEWRWRNDARAHEEAIRQAQENLDLLRNQADDLRSRIRYLISEGHRATELSYDTTRLAQIEAQIPYAEQDLARAQRAWDQFRDDARRQGILPGWLR